MRIGYLDCASGASGDMLLGALLGAGWSEAALRDVVEALRVPVRIRVSRADRQGVPAVRVEVEEEVSPESRTYSRLTDLLAESAIEAPVREAAAAVLRRLAGVEAEIHGVPLDRVHLHELGGADTLVDIAGVLSGVRALGLDRITASPVNIGRGWAQIRHGMVPLPAPATAAFLEGMPVYATEAEGEWLTPTGAVLLSTLVTRWGPLPLMRLRRIGTGAGREDPPHANVLRLFVGDAMGDPENRAPEDAAAGGPAFSRTERLIMLETAIDDMNPQLYPYVTERLHEEGAFEVTIVPALMKKGRPGHVLRVLAPPERTRALCGVLLAETTTIGVRSYEVTRLAAGRRTAEVETEFGPVPVKVAGDASGVLNVSPEFDACRALAAHHRVPVKRVMAAAQRAAASLLNQGAEPGSAPGEGA
ncbi:MAG TPA: nickel pincer cofactor biosynthesis protein LarC [bacterium]|nr:nickel pincer cofactor biosynthesis protein LarC [bacterium]